MKISFVIACLCSLALGASVAWAQNIPLQNLGRGDYARVVGEFSAGARHTTVSGARPLGDIFGIEAGIVLGATNTPEVNKLVKQADASASVGQVPHGTIYAAVSVPFAITAELAWLPYAGPSSFKFNQLSLAVKWTLSELFFELPVDVAIKGQVGRAGLKFDAQPGGVPTHFDYENTLFGGEVFVSKDLGIVSPYVSFGTLKATGKMNVSGSSSVFADPEMKASASASESRLSGTWSVGTEINLGVIKAGVEYASAFTTSGFSGKLAYYF